MTLEEKLFHRYYKPICTWSMNNGNMPQDAEDVASTTILKFFDAKERGMNIRNPDAYIWAIARYAHLDTHRATKKERKRFENATQQFKNDMFVKDFIEDTINQDEAEQFAKLSLHILSEKQLCAIYARYWEGISWEEAAEKYGMTVNGMKGLANRARIRLKNTYIQALGLRYEKPVRSAGGT